MIFSKIKISLLVNVVIGAIFLVAGTVSIIFLVHQNRQQALKEAETKARILLDSHLATHSYFSNQLKPNLFKIIKPHVSDDYFDPTWMSSTFAVRELEKYFDSLNPNDYYYKECAINARSPENEADRFERNFIKELNNKPDLVQRSVIRKINGEPFYSVLRRGEVMEQSCLRCHSTPDKAPKGLVEKYGPSRSFHREAGEVVSAISIRIPLSAAYAATKKNSIILGGIFLCAILFLFLTQFWIHRRFIFSPLKVIHSKALQIFSGKEHPYEEIALSQGKELRELALAFNKMSVHLKQNRDNLENQVQERTQNLIKIKESLEREVRERKRTQEIVNQLNREILLILNSAGEGILGLDENGSMKFVNPAAAKMLGYSTQELINEPSHELWHHTKPDGTPYPREDCSIYKAYKDGKVHSSANEFFFKKDGSRFPVEYISTPIQNAEGEIEGAVVTFKDITQKKKFEEELMRSQRLESVSILAGGFAHNLNNTLSPVLMASQMLLQQNHDENTLKYLRTINDHTRRAADLVEEVLVVTRGAEGKFKKIDVKQFVENLSRNLHETYPNNIDIEIDVADDVTDIEGDMTQLHQVIANICKNSRDAMPDGGTLRITVENRLLSQDDTKSLFNKEDRNFVVFTISDTGIGIPAENLDKIFDPFFTTKPLGKANGLGLSMVQPVIKSHGGFVSVNSQPSKGTTFQIHLPAAGSSNHQRQELVELKEEPSILLINSDESLNGRFAELLNKHKFETVNVNNGTEAIARAAQYKGSFNFIIADLETPEMKGTMVLHILQKMSQNSQFIIIISDAAQEQSLEDENIRVHSIFYKPVQLDDIVENIVRDDK